MITIADARRKALSLCVEALGDRGLEGQSRKIWIIEFDECPNVKGRCKLRAFSEGKESAHPDDYYCSEVLAETDIGTGRVQLTRMELDQPCQNIDSKDE